MLHVLTKDEFVVGVYSSESEARWAAGFYAMNKQEGVAPDRSGFRITKREVNSTSIPANSTVEL